MVGIEFPAFAGSACHPPSRGWGRHQCGRQADKQIDRDAGPHGSRDVFLLRSEWAGPRADLLHDQLWKLVVIGPAVTDPDADDSKRQKYLYLIRDDPNERDNVAAEHPDVVEELYKKVKAFRALQPADAVQPFSQGTEGFKAPKDWRMGDY